jgi:hypothetical protein
MGNPAIQFLLFEFVAHMMEIFIFLRESGLPSIIIKYNNLNGRHEKTPQQKPVGRRATDTL